MSQSTQPPHTLYQGVDKTSSGYKLLESMGWKEGEGLGAQKQGIITHVRVKKKDGALGVGAAEQASRLRDWTTGMFSYESILTSLKEIKAVRPELDTDSDEDVVEPCTSAAAAVAASPSKAAAKVSKKQAASQAAAAAAAAADAEAAGAKKTDKSKKRKLLTEEGPTKGATSLAAPAVAAASVVSSLGPTAKLATHVGRYQKRERAKKVGNYSSTDLAAILGNTAAATADSSFVPAPAPVFAPIEDSGDSSASDDEAAAATTTAQPDPHTDGRPTKRASLQDADAERAASAGAASTSAPEAPSWWSSLFVRSGRMGSMRKETRVRKAAAASAAPVAGQRAAIQVSGFREADQENLYEQAHDKATHGRQGLGRSDMPRKVAGTRWCGTKTKLTTDGDSDDEVDDGDGKPHEEARQGGQEQDDEDDEAQGIVVLAAKSATAGSGAKSAVAAVKEELVEAGGRDRAGASKRRDVGGTAADATAVASKHRSGLGIKWAKLARQVLADTPQRRLKITKLQKRLLAAAAASLADEADGGLLLAGVAEAMMKRLRRCARLQVCDKFVGLVGTDNVMGDD